MSKYQRKWKQGRRLHTIQDVMETQVFWWRGKVYQKGWVFSWPLNFILGRLRADAPYALYSAYPNVDEEVVHVR